FDQPARGSGSSRQLWNSSRREVEFRAAARGRFWHGGVPIRRIAGATGSAETGTKIVWRADSKSASTTGDFEVHSDQHHRLGPEAFGRVGPRAVADRARRVDEQSAHRARYDPDFLEYQELGKHFSGYYSADGRCSRGAKASELCTGARAGFRCY